MEFLYNAVITNAKLVVAFFWTITALGLINEYAVKVCVIPLQKNLDRLFYISLLWINKYFNFSKFISIPNPK